jgi:hypothetical protein
MRIILIIFSINFVCDVNASDGNVVIQHLNELKNQGVIDAQDIRKIYSSKSFGLLNNELTSNRDSSRRVDVGVSDVLEMLTDNKIINNNDSLLLLNLTTNSRFKSKGSQIKSFYADAVLVFVEAGFLLVNEWKVLTAKIKPIFNTAKAMSQAIKMKSDEILAANKNKRIRDSKIDFMKENSSVYFKGKEFKVGGVSASGCFKKKQSDANKSIVDNIFPVVKDINEELVSTIDTDSAKKSGYNRLNRVNLFLGNRVNPFLGETSVENKKELSFAIKQFVNPKLFKIAQGGTLDSIGGDRASKYFRYEMMVKVLQNVVSKLASYKLTDGAGISEEFVDKRMYAKSVSNNINMSLTVKNIDGNYKELNETLSNRVKLKMDDLELQQLKLQILSVLASSSVDAFESGL